MPEKKETAYGSSRALVGTLSSSRPHSCWQFSHSRIVPSCSERRLGARPMWSRSHACRLIQERGEIRHLLVPDKNKDDAARLGSPQTTSARLACFASFRMRPAGKKVVRSE